MTLAWTVTRSGARRFSFDGFVADLELDGDGLVLVYPGLARRASG